MKRYYNENKRFDIKTLRNIKIKDPRKFWEVLNGKTPQKLKQSCPMFFV